MMPYWYIIPAFAAISAGGATFVFARSLRRSQKFLGFTFIFEGLLFILSGIVHVSLERMNLSLYLLYAIMMLTSPFFYYFAVRFLLKTEGAGKKDLWMLEAVAVFAVIFATVSIRIPATERDLFLKIIKGKTNLGMALPTGTAVLMAFDDIVYLFAIIEQLFIFIFCYISMRGYVRLLSNYYSNLEGKSTNLLYTVFGLVTLRFFVFILIGFFPQIIESNWFHIAGTLVFALFYAGLLLAVLQIKHTAEELSKMADTQTAGGQLPAANELISARLNKLVEEKFFTNPDVNLMDMASKIQVNSKYIGDFLHFHYEETFLTFVNRLRVEYAIELMNNPELTLLDIAEQSGFISISTFYRNFTKVKGVSPSQFRKGRNPELPLSRDGQDAVR